MIALVLFSRSMLKAGSVFNLKRFCISPVCPEEMDWSELYPHFFPESPSEQKSHQVEFADIGCGYGGLLGDLTGSVWSDAVLLCVF